MITQSGPKCDVCGDYILFDKSINPFKMACFKEKELHCHDKCKPIVSEVSIKNDWKLLQDGPIRKAIEEYFKEN